MKRLYFSKLVILVSILSGLNRSAIAQPLAPVTYSTPCGTVSYTVPLGVFSINVDMRGATGGVSGYNYGIGGAGGQVLCNIATTPGSVLFLNIGGVGTNAPTSVATYAGGCNGGGDGRYAGGAGGGGATDIRYGGTALTNRIVVAGGGGGGGYGCSGSTVTGIGGKGGGLTGENGWMCNSNAGTSYACYWGSGGSQTAGGATGTCNSGNTASTGATGGLGATGYYGGGGGGGYWGGGGAYGGGGGGGSSYPAADGGLITGLTHNQGVNTTGNGSITITGNCTAPTAGAIVGPTNICGAGGTFLYTSPTSSTGGVWSSSTTGVATIDAASGILVSTGVGTTVIKLTITYACGAPAISSVTVNVNPLPGAYTGTPVVCVGGAAVTLTGSGGGTWSVSNTGLATMTPGPGAGNLTGLVASNPILTYTLPTGCYSTTTATVNPKPAPIQPASLSMVCFPTTVTFSDATAGGTWSSTTTMLSINPTTGLATPDPLYEFGGTTGDNSTTIIYTNTTTGCQASKSFTVNPMPNPYNLYQPSGFTNRCSNMGGIPLSIPGSDINTSYQLYYNWVSYGSPFAGTGGAISWPPLKYDATYNIIATTAFSCKDTMPGSPMIHVDTTPVKYTLGFVGASSFCSGSTTGPDLILSGSQSNVTYQLLINGNPDAPLAGTGSALNFGNSFITTGTYQVIAYDDFPKTCSDTMSGIPVLTINPLPAVDTIEGGGSLCPHGAGKVVRVKTNTTLGVNYELSRNSLYVMSLPGSGSSLSFPAHTLPGVYTVRAVNAITGCSQDAYSATPITISIYTPPTADSITGGGNYCAGGNGIHLFMKSTQPGIEYQLWNAGTPIGGKLIGAGSVNEDLGPQYIGGVYTVIAKDPATSCTTNMLGNAVINVDPLPVAGVVGGGGSYCVSGGGKNVTLNPSDLTVSYQLMYASAPLGAALTGTGGVLDFGVYTGTGNYTVVATDGTTGCTNTMTGSVTISTNPLPTQYMVTGAGNYCTGGAGKHVSLAYSGLGVDYQLYNNGVAVGSIIHGSNSSIDFGVFTALGNYSVIGTNTTTTCSDTMANSVVLTTSPPPTVYPVTASGSSYCAGDAGINIQLASSQAGVYYQFYRTGLPLGPAVPGTGLALDFGWQTLPGVYTIQALNTGSGCSATMFGSIPVTINPLPTVYTVTGGGNFCAGGTGVSVGLSKSDTWQTYQLVINGVPSGSPKAGTGTTLDFGLQTTSGTYTVIAINPLSTCTNSMLGSVMVNPKPAPNAFTVTGGGAICAGSTGTSLGLSGSDVGVSYQLYNGTGTVGAALPGTNVGLDFGIHSVSGTYTIIATTTSSSCTKTMTGSAAINVNPLPGAFTVYGGGAFCAGSTGAHVMLSGSVTGINYQLMMGSTKIGGFKTGTGAAIDFGAITASGSYTTIATDAITGCSSNMMSAATVTANPLPVVYSVTGGGHYCSAMAGVPVGVSFSVAGTKYQLWRGTTAVGMPKAGGGLPLDFGPQTIAGSYTVMASDAITGCSQNMTGSATVTPDPVTPPAVTISTGIGDTVCAGKAYTFSPAPVNGGGTPSYIWKVNGTVKAFTTDYIYTPANGDVVSVQMISSASCAVPTTANGSILMTVKPFQMPAATITVDPGVALCKGTPATFNVSVSNEGYAPVLNWVKNSKIVATGTSYTYTPDDKDVVIFMLGSSYPCRLNDTVFSNTFKMDVDPAIAPVVNIVATQGTVLAPGQTDTFRAVVTNAGTYPKYQWSNNGAAIWGATNSTFISNEFFNGDSLSVEVVSTAGCGLSSYNSIIISIKNLGVRQVTSANSNISVMPNPNKGEFIVKGSLSTVSDEEVVLEVTNMLGQVVYANKVMAHNGNIEERVMLNKSIANGMYILNVRSGSEHNVYHIVVEQ